MPFVHFTIVKVLNNVGSFGTTPGAMQNCAVNFSVLSQKHVTLHAAVDFMSCLLLNVYLHEILSIL